MWRPSEHGGEMQPHDEESCDVCGRYLYDGICRNPQCSLCPNPPGLTEQTWTVGEGKEKKTITRKGYPPANAR